MVWRVSDFRGKLHLKRQQRMKFTGKGHYSPSQSRLMGTVLKALSSERGLVCWTNTGLPFKAHGFLRLFHLCVIHIFSVI